MILLLSVSPNWTSFTWHSELSFADNPVAQRNASTNKPFFFSSVSFFQCLARSFYLQLLFSICNNIRKLTGEKQKNSSITKKKSFVGSAIEFKIIFSLLKPRSLIHSVKRKRQSRLLRITFVSGVIAASAVSPRP